MSIVEKIKINTVERVRENLKNSEGNYISVIAHRGDWRNAPENSIQAIQNCIDMEVDMVEVDVRKTKDNQFVIIHDATLDRTTTGTGLVSEWTLDSLKTLYLKNGLGIPTYQKIPTLKEVLEFSKNKIFINLDKSYASFDEVIKIIIETKMSNQVLLKGKVTTVEKLKLDLGANLGSVYFMPVIHLDKQKRALELIIELQKEIKPIAIELIFSNKNSEVLNKISEIKQNGSNVWVNSLWASLNAGYEDEMALMHTDSIYGWYLQKGINMIQTDRPKLLLRYLKNKNRHQ
jgi:glycerophosphoryl diester phosphodiesterase